MAKINTINNSTEELTIDPGTGDSFLQFDINGTGEFRIGVDDDDSDKFKISQGSALGSNDCIVIESTGEITKPLQPAFLAYLGTTDTNVTGDSSVYVLGGGNALTEIYDIGSNFNTNGTFTAPKTAKYFFQFTIGTADLIGQNYLLIISTTDRDYYINKRADVTSNGYQRFCGSLLVSLTAADTVQFKMVCAGGSKTVDANAGVEATFCMGTLVC